jgi:VanZ family protein
MKDGRPNLGRAGIPLALYLFDERAGEVVRDHGRSGIDLSIPKRYAILDQVFLEPPWTEFNPSWSYWKSVLVNIGGFVPFGFALYAHRSSARQAKRVMMATVLLGLTVSLTIEVLQAYLPTRNSGMTDLFTNTLGTFLGALFWRRCRLARILYCRSLDRIEVWSGTQRPAIVEQGRAIVGREGT